MTKIAVQSTASKISFALKSLADPDPVHAALNRHLALRLPPGDFIQMQGHIGSRQARVLGDCVAGENITHAGQIGFNAGHSASTILSANRRVRLVSFDLGAHGYVDTAARYISRRFPGRHQLVLGRSQETVSEYAETSPNTRFGFMFIDGGHTEEEAWSDLVNSQRVCMTGALVLMDDVIPDYAHGVGPSRAWDRAVAEGLVLESDRFTWPPQDGRPKRTIAAGTYL